MDTINVTGGVVDTDEGWVPVADPEWYDLASVYRNACDVLGVEPIVSDGDLEEG